MNDGPRRALAAALLLLAAHGCDDGAAAPGPAGGPVNGPIDSHCTPDGGAKVQETSQAACRPDLAGASDDAGASGEPEFGETEFNTEGDDDDCKYHVKFSVTPIYEGEDATITVTVTRRSDTMAAAGAMAGVELFLDETHPAPNAPTHTTEGAGGVYTIGPVLFDASGRWTLRFHVYEDCFDLAEDSPHGHVAFYLDVP